MTYTDDISKPGEYPRGIPDYTSPSLINEVFAHPNGLGTAIIDHQGPYPCKDHGHRNEWISLVKYADGFEKVFYLPCKPIVIAINMEEFYKAVNNLEMQRPYASSGKNTESVVGKYSKADFREKEKSRVCATLGKINALDSHVKEVL